MVDFNVVIGTSDLPGGGWGNVQKKDVFSLWLNHGRNIKGEKYKYIVLPGISKKELENYIKDIPI